MRTIKVKLDDNIFVFKVQTNGSLAFGNLKTSPCRIIAIPSGASLYQLAEAITDSFDFYFDHCFGFFDNLENPFKSKTGFEMFADAGEESKFPGVKKTKISEAFPDIKAKMLFYFDYGDEWTFPVELIEIRKPQTNKKYPMILEKIGESPEQYPSMEDEEDMNDSIKVILSVEEKDLILNHTLARDDLIEQLKDSPPVKGRILVLYNREELDELIGHLAAEANHAKDKNIQNKLDALCKKLEEIEGDKI